MGKSPGKWIKSLLFGKKSSKSNLSKEVTGERRSATKASSMEDLAPNPPIQNFKRGSENTEQKKMTSTGIMCDSADLSSVAQHIESQVTKGVISPDNAELKRLEQAAIKAQAAFRGYLWLERWSLSRFWEPFPQTKKVVEAKSQKKQAAIQTAETARPKRSVRKVLSAATGDANILSSSEPEKSRHNIRKVTNHQIESAQDQPQNELERVKRNLRKVTGAVATAPEKSEAETEKARQIHIPVQTQAKTLISSAYNPVPVKMQATNVDELVVVNSPEKMSDSIPEIDKLAVTEVPTAVVVEEPKDVLHNHPTVEQQQLEDEKVGKSENSPIVNEELSPNEYQTCKERTRRRRSLPSKKDNSENISQNTPSVPSYMASTVSAKAKLKGQGSPKVSEDGAENGLVRRHSLPSSTNGKFSSLSPGMQRPGQASVKSGNLNRSMSASKDEKVLQPSWRR